MTADGVNPTATLAALNLRSGVEVSVFTTDATLVARAAGNLNAEQLADLELQTGGTLIIDFLASIWDGLAGLVSFSSDDLSFEQQLIALSQENVRQAIIDGTQLEVAEIAGRASFIVTTPILRGETPVGVIAVRTAAGEVDSLVRREREQVLRLFLVGIAISIGLSLSLIHI